MRPAPYTPLLALAMVAIGASCSTGPSDPADSESRILVRTPILGAEGVEGRNPASTTRVTSMPSSDALRWYDEAERRDRADLVR